MTFEESWPEISRRLSRLVAARRVPDAQRDDIIQETGIRLFRAWDRVDPERGAWGFARAIAIHAIADAAKAHGGYELTELTELPDVSDPEGAGIARFRLASIRRALAQMSVTDRRVLLAEVGAATTPALARSALKMARSRARQRLRVLVEKPGSWGVLPQIPFRVRVESGRRFFQDRFMMKAQFAEGALAAVAGLAMTVTALSGGSDIHSAHSSTDDRRSARVLSLDAALIKDRLQTLRSRRVSGFPSVDDEVITGGSGGGSNGESEHWVRETAAATKETAKVVGEDAKRLQGDAEQGKKDAQQLGEDAEQLGEDGEQLAEDLPP